MTADKCLQILREVKDASFATVDKSGRPAVRIIDVMLVENQKLYFCTARGKDFYEQLIIQNDVAITAMNRDYQMIRLSGKAEKLTEQKKWIDWIFDENQVMNGVYPNESRYILEPFCISDAQIEFFDLGESPIYRESFSLGTSETEEKGYIIGSGCIACGKCAKGCPQQCIESGKPFVIKQENCLHCGLCFENCPVKAIVKRGKQNS